jgi:uncharacterized protein
MEGRTVYFAVRGRDNTAATIRIAHERAEELAIHHLVVASTHGETALEAARVFQGSETQIISVSLSPAFDEMGWTLSPAERRKQEERGIRVLTSLHALADGIAEGFFGQATLGNVVADTLRCFSQGMKVAVEISLMAAEAGLVAPGSEIIAVAGTDGGADTAVVLRPTFARKVKDLRICEILCKPRIG